jgi:hypothetical protein
MVASGQVSREGLLGSMKAMVEMYQNTYRAFASGGVPGFDFVQQKPDPGTAEALPDGSAAPAPASIQPSVEELRRRVEALERLIPRIPLGDPRRKRSACSASGLAMCTAAQTAEIDNDRNQQP